MINAIDLTAAGMEISSVALVALYLRERARVAEFTRRITSGCRSQREAVFALGRAIFSGVKRGPDPIFLTQCFSPFGASPTAVLEQGGCCSGIHRLFITALDTIEIPSAQITVYRGDGHLGAHCLTQVMVDGENTLIDVDYGVWLKNPTGGELGLTELRAGLAPTIEPFVANDLACDADGTKSRRAGYPEDEYYEFDFALSRTANWTTTAFRRGLYAIVRPLTNGRVDCFLVPPIFEWPQISLSLALSTAGLVLIAAKLV